MYLGCLRYAAGSRGNLNKPIQLPSYEEYAKNVMAELEAREAAVRSELERVDTAARRGAVQEVPMAQQLLLMWGRALTQELKADHMKVGDKYQTEERGYTSSFFVDRGLK